MLSPQHCHLSSRTVWHLEPEGNNELAAALGVSGFCPTGTALILDLGPPRPLLPWHAFRAPALYTYPWQGLLFVQCTLGFESRVPGAVCEEGTT